MTNFEKISGLFHIEDHMMPAGFDPNTWTVSVSVDEETSAALRAVPGARPARFLSAVIDGGHIQGYATFIRSTNHTDEFQLALMSIVAKD